MTVSQRGDLKYSAMIYGRCMAFLRAVLLPDILSPHVVDTIFHAPGVDI